MAPRAIGKWILPALLMSVLACDGSAGGNYGTVDAGPLAPPAGACLVQGNGATGSTTASCIQCGVDKCNKELSDKAGSAWAQDYLGGNGACVGFDACICDCAAQGMGLATCALSGACFGMLDGACAEAIGVADTCMTENCEELCSS